MRSSALTLVQQRCFLLAFACIHCSTLQLNVSVEKDFAEDQELSDTIRSVNDKHCIICMTVFHLCVSVEFFCFLSSPLVS